MTDWRQLAEELEKVFEETFPVELLDRSPDPLRILLVPSADAPNEPSYLISLHLDVGFIRVVRAGGDEAASVTVEVSPEWPIRLLSGIVVDRDVATTIMPMIGTSQLQVRPPKAALLLLPLVSFQLAEEQRRGVTDVLARHGSSLLDQAGVQVDRRAFAWPRQDSLDEIPVVVGASDDGAMAENLTAYVRREIAGQTTAGVQIVVRRGGRDVVTLAAGWAGAEDPMLESTVQPWACCSKVIGALLFAHAWSDDRLDPEQSIADVVPEFGAYGKGDVTFRHLLSHTTNVEGEALWLEFLSGRPPDLDRICRLPVLAGVEPGSRPNYSILWGWAVLAEALARIEGIGYCDLAWHKILGDLDHSGEIIFGPARVSDGPAMRSNLHITRYWYRGAGAPLPEQPFVGPTMLHQGSPSSGAYGSARALTDLLGVIRQAQNNAWGLVTPATMEACLGPARPPMRDPFLFGRELGWGLGLMNDFSFYRSRRAARPVDPVDLVGHIGLGSACSVWRPADDTQVTVLWNCTLDTAPARRREAALLEIVFGGREPLRV